MNPLKGLKRMFGPHGVWTLIKSLLKTGALAVVVYLSVRKLHPDGDGLGLAADLRTCSRSACRPSCGLVRYAAVAGLAMAAADFAVVRKRNNKSLKMSKQEIKEEFKSQEGDPHVRGQRRSAADGDASQPDDGRRPDGRRRDRQPDPRRRRAAVTTRRVAHRASSPRAATTSPPGSARIAEEHRIPMVADVPLARTLFKACEIGQEIPPDLYKAVATVLAFIMTLKKRGSAAGVHKVKTLALAS